MRKEYFIVSDSPYHPGKYTIRLDFNSFPKMVTIGSYSIMGARVLGISFANYLRFCRDVYGAEIIGKKTMYPVAYFSDEEKAKELAKFLNKKINEQLK